MCGRYHLTLTIEEIERLLAILERPNVPPRYNIAPTQAAPVVRRRKDGTRVLSLLRWGLVPAWAGDLAVGSRMINARSETVAEKPAFRRAFEARRCLVPADGFYEWKAEGRSRQPYRIRRPDGAGFVFAGLWERWHPRRPAPGQGPVDTFTIMTTEANERLGSLHHRMPVILEPADHETWLAGDAAAARALLRPYPADGLELFPVSPRVNDVRNDDAGCLARAEPPAAPAGEQLSLI